MNKSSQTGLVISIVLAVAVSLVLGTMAGGVMASSHARRPSGPTVENVPEGFEQGISLTVD